MPDDPMEANRRAVFIEGCNMFRHMVMMRYYTLAAFAVGNAALVALFFSYRPLDALQKWAIKIVAAVIPLLCIGFELRITQLIAHFQEEINRRAESYGVKQFIPPGTLFWILDVTAICAILIYLVSTFVWLFFA
jgi:hypothetical protein